MKRLACLLLALSACLVVAVPSASADDRTISKRSGVGKQAADAAKKRVGGGTVVRVRVDDDDDANERYRVDIRRRINGRLYKYEVDVSASFRVTDVERERVGRFGDDDDDD